MELCGQSLHESRLQSPTDFDYNLKLSVLTVSNPTVMPETSYSDNRTTLLSEQNNIKESDVFSKLALEIEASNASHIRNEFGQVTITTYQSLEEKDEFLFACEDASDSEEDSNGFGLSRHVSPGLLRSKMASVQEIS